MLRYFRNTNFELIFSNYSLYFVCFAGKISSIICRISVEYEIAMETTTKKTSAVCSNCQRMKMRDRLGWIFYLCKIILLKSIQLRFSSVRGIGLETVPTWSYREDLLDLLYHRMCLTFPNLACRLLNQPQGNQNKWTCRWSISWSRTQLNPSTIFILKRNWWKNMTMCLHVGRKIKLRSYSWHKIFWLLI